MTAKLKGKTTECGYPLVHDIDWSQSHCGLMLCSFEQAYKLMPEVTPVLQELIPQLELSVEDYLVDVRVSMLMPKQYAALPNWHLDFMPRDENNKRTKAKPSPLKMYMWLSGAPLTEYRNIKTKELYKKPPQVWHSFTQSDLHRATVSEDFTWRCFIRVIPKSFPHKCTRNAGTIRRHSQVYLDSEVFSW